MLAAFVAVFVLVVVCLFCTAVLAVGEAVRTVLALLLVDVVDFVEEFTATLVLPVPDVVYTPDLRVELVDDLTLVVELLEEEFRLPLTTFDRLTV